MQPLVDSLIIVLMVCPNDFLFFVGNVETYFTHTIDFRIMLSPIVNLFYGCVPIVIQIWLEIWGTFVPLVCAVKVSALVTTCHLIVPRYFTTWFIIETLEC